MQTHWRLAKNAVANLARGGTAGVLAIFLPAVLVRHMNQTEYSVWVLVLQVAAYSGYLEFGLQTAVGRYIAVARENRDGHLRDSIFSTASAGLALAAVLGIVLLVGIACAAGWLFPKVPAAMLFQMRCALLIIGTSISLGLPSAAWCGVFIGLEKNELIAIVTGGSKLLSALCLVIAAIHGFSIVVMAVIVAGGNLLSYMLLYFSLRRFSEVTFQPELVRQSTARELFQYCFGLVVWSSSTILVSGLDLILVGRFQLSALAPYALATTLVNFIAGIQTAIFGAIMPHAAALHARKDSTALGNVVISSTRLGVIVLILTGMPLLIYANPILRTWVGEKYAVEGYLPLTILLLANMIRLTAVPYATVLVASAQQKLITLSPIMEGLSNLFASILLGIKFGAIGVAAGTLIGAVIGILGHVFYNMPRTRKEISLRAPDFLLSAVGVPVMATIPLLALAVHLWNASPPRTSIFAAIFAITLLLSVLIIFSAQSKYRLTAKSRTG
jgi:O-antigen/teichoic acid export membrane protein